MKKSLITACLYVCMLVAAMPLGASSLWNTTYMTNEASSVPEKSRGIVARMDLPEFKGVYCDVIANITIEQGNEYLIEARGPEHLVLLINPEVNSNGVLTIKAKKEYKVNKNNGITIRIVTPAVDMIFNEGVGNIHLKGIFKSSMMTITNEGVGNITFDNFQCDILQVINEGVGNIELTGNAAKRAIFKSNGVGGINAYNTVVPDLVAELNGVGSIECHVTERLTAQANGVGNIYYKGNPTNTNISRNGIGKVYKE